MSSLPASMKKIRSKMKALEWSEDFSHYKSMGIFPDAQEQQLRTPWSDLAEFQTHPRCYRCPYCKYEEDPIKNEGARVVRRFLPL